MSFWASHSPSPISLPSFNGTYASPHQPSTPPQSGPSSQQASTSTKAKAPASTTPPKSRRPSDDEISAGPKFNKYKRYFPAYDDRALARIAKETERAYNFGIVLEKHMEKKAREAMENGEAEAAAAQRRKNVYILPPPKWRVHGQGAAAVSEEQDVLVLREPRGRDGQGRRVQQVRSRVSRKVQCRIREYSRGVRMQTRDALLGVARRRDEAEGRTCGEVEELGSGEAELPVRERAAQRGSEERVEREWEGRDGLGGDDGGEPLSMDEHVKLNPLRKVFNEEGNTAECRPPIETQPETGEDAS